MIIKNILSESEMQLYELLNELLELINIHHNNKDILNSHNKVIIDKNGQITNIIFTINNDQQFGQYIDEALTLLQKKTYLSKETKTDFILRELILSKTENNNYTIDNTKHLVQQLIELEIETTQVVTNIIGIALADNQEPIQLGCFEIGYNRDIKNKTSQIKSIPKDFFQNENLLYFKANIFHLDLQDHKGSQEKILLYSLDFIRLLLFISGDFNFQYKVQINSASYHEFGNLIITDLQTYYYFTLDWQSLGMSGAKETTYKLHINDMVSSDYYASFHKLWELYEKKSQNSTLITDIEKRVVSASLAIGESIRSEEKRNALIYTCIALEALFSYDEGQLFQKSIGEKISNCLAFIVGTNKEGRKGIIKHTKEIYSARSALVHGSQPSKSIDLYWINDFIRTAISELLNNKKYKDIRTIKQLYDLITDTQLSY